jgi:hypothetical protein
MANKTRYEPVYRSLGYPAEATELASGAIRSPDNNADAGLEFTVFPPALVPLLSDGEPSYLGGWVHPFARRTPTFVRLSLEDQIVYEVARTWEQMKAILVLGSQWDGIPKVRDFAIKLSFHDVDTLDAHVRNHGDDPARLASYPPFATQTPLESTPRGVPYDGEFPDARSSSAPIDVSRCCLYEVPLDLRGKLNASWLDPSVPPPSAFTQCMQAADLDGAWLSLNAPGWSMDDARKAAREMRLRSDGVTFAPELLDAWLDVQATTRGGY